MKIYVTAGTGTAPTALGAFDQALIHAGIANYNLIYLSSVIPPGSEIIDQHTPPDLAGKWGDRLYVVVAQGRVVTPNQEAWAGIGWVHNPKGQGVFVEHHGASEESVRRDIEQSMQTLVDGRPDEHFGPLKMRIVGARCEGNPVCALVAATFETAPWEA